MFSFNFKIMVLIKVEVKVNKHCDLDKGSGGDAGDVFGLLPATMGDIPNRPR